MDEDQTEDDVIEGDERWGRTADTIRTLTGGRVFLRVCGQEYLMQAPSMRACRDLSDLQHDMTKDLTRMQIELQNCAIEARQALGKDDQDDLIANLEARTTGLLKQVEELSDSTSEGMRTIVSAVSVGNPVLPPVEDLPPWFGSQDFVAQILEHWRRCPQAPGRK